MVNSFPGNRYIFFFFYSQFKLNSSQNLATKIVWLLLSLHNTDLCWKKVSRDLQTVYLSWMVNRCSSCWPKVRPRTLMLGGRISATHCRELRAGDLWKIRVSIHLFLLIWFLICKCRVTWQSSLMLVRPWMTANFKSKCQVCWYVLTWSVVMF